MSDEAKVSGAEQPGVNKRSLVFRIVIYTAIVVAILFLSAGDWGWSMGWVYISIFGLVNVLSILLVPIDQELVDERTQLKEDVKTWDKWLATIPSVLFPFGFVVVGALDHRFGWSGSFSFPLTVAAGVISVAGYGFSLWAARVNKFYARYVRIQKERGHSTVTEGPYRIVRHPGYAGLIWYCLASAVILDSMWAFVPAGLIVVLLIIRTALEDRTLKAELTGYKEYTQQTSYRLLPGIW